MNPHAVAQVKIVRAPRGEAPDWVREAWVGLVLPLKESRLTTVTTSGVLSGSRSAMGMFWASLTGAPVSMTGYLTPAARAIEILERAQPKAAAWWREHAPKFLREEAEFLFDAPACVRVDAG